jgi:hypothetical protein
MPEIHRAPWPRPGHEKAGNSPAMVHKNYKGLMTKKDGKAWFAVASTQAANVIPLPAATRKEAH